VLNCPEPTVTLDYLPVNHIQNTTEIPIDVNLISETEVLLAGQLGSLKMAKQLVWTEYSWNYASQQTTLFHI